MLIRKWFIQGCIGILMLTGIIILYLETQEVSAVEIGFLKNQAQRQLKLSLNDLENDAFIVSENHGFKTNEEIRYDFLTYLHRENDVDYYLAEISFSSGYLLNEYVQSGNEELLKQVFSFYKGSPFYTKEKYSFFKKLYQYNQNHSKKIKVVGFDIEHSLQSALYFYNYYTNEDKKEITFIYQESFEDPVLNHLKKTLLSYQTFYKNYNWEKRDQAMYENFLFLDFYYGINKFYAQVGAKHGLTDLTSDNYKSFAYFLNHDHLSPVKNKVLGIKIFYKESYYLETTYKDSYRSRYTFKTYETNALDVFNEELTLFKINDKHSPYHHHLIWYDQSINKSDKVTTDYYHYILLVNQSKASTPIN